MWAQEGLSWFVGLTNLGGGFVLAAVVLMLHRDSLKAFREELASERATHTQEIKSFLEMKLRHHEEVMGRLSTIEAQVTASGSQTLEKIRDLLENHKKGRP